MTATRDTAMHLSCLMLNRVLPGAQPLRRDLGRGRARAGGVRLVYLRLQGMLCAADRVIRRPES